MGAEPALPAAGGSDVSEQTKEDRVLAILEEDCESVVTGWVLGYEYIDPVSGTKQFSTMTHPDASWIDTLGLTRALTLWFDQQFMVAPSVLDDDEEEGDE